MNQHFLWVPTLKSDWFRDMMQFLDGNRREVPLGTIRDHIGREVNLGPLDFITARNNAFQTGILQEDAHGVVHFNADVLDAIIKHADAEGITERISVKCTEPNCKNYSKVKK